MPEYRDEGREAPSGGGDNQPDEIPDETPDAPDETPDEGLFNPNDDAPNETPDEELFNPNDETPDEELFNPNDETPDEELFNPNDETPDEELFNPNDETPDEELFNPNDETPDKELFNPNDDVPDETPDEELFNPNDDVPDESPDENYNPSSSATITVTVQEETREGSDNASEDDSEQENENEPETEQESESEEDPEKEIEFIGPEGEPMDPVDSKDVMDLRADLEEWGFEPEYDPEIESELEDHNSETELDNEPELESEVESEHSSENKPENEQESNPEVFELLTHEGEPISHPQEVPTELIPIEEAIEKLYEQQHSYEEELENEPDEILEQESEILSDQKSELAHEQKPEHIRKKKRIKAKDLELITDSKELDEYKHYEREHIIKTKYDVIFREKPTKQPEKKQGKPQKKKSKKVKDLELITDPKELDHYTNWGDTKTDRNQTKNISEKSEDDSEKSSKQDQDTKPKEIKNLELITEPNKTEKNEEKNESELEKSSESQSTSKKELNKIEIAGSESQKQSKLRGDSDKQSKSETVSKKRLELREKYRQEMGKRPIYNKKETKGFLSWLEKQKKLAIKKKQEKREEKIGEIKEEWQILLEKWVWEANESKISKEVKEELIDIIRKYRKFREMYLKLIKLLERRNITKEISKDIEKLINQLEQMNHIQAKLFRNLKAFRSLYNQYHIWDINRILREREKFINHLIQKLQNLKINERTPQGVEKNWKEILKENLHRITTLSLNQKSQIVKIIQKEKLSEEDKMELVSLLKKLPIEDLISLLGKDFEKHSKNYVRWGWDFYEYIKKDMLNSYINFNDALIENSKLRSGRGIYDRLEERVIIEPNILREVCDEIRAKYPNKRLPDYILSKIIGGHKNVISNALVGSTIPLKIFKKLEEILGKPIPHKITSSIGELIELEENEETAEFISIMLGDGHFSEKLYSIVITLNGIDEYPYVKYLKNLMKRILNKEPVESWSKYDKDPKRMKGVKLRVYSLAIVEALKKVGLIPGNKVEHQVSIPERFKKFVKACLKGLIDTDGTIYIQKNDKSFVIAFVNGSKNLVEDFKQLCSKLNIQTTKVNHYLRKDDNKYIYSVSIGSKEMVKFFLTKVDPEKWKDKNRRKFWGIQLIYLNAAEKIRNSIKKQIVVDYPDLTKRKYSIEFLKYLKKLCKKNGLVISPQDIENAISNAFEYKKSSYSREVAEYLKTLFIKSGDLKRLKEQFQGTPIAQKTILKYLFLLFDEEDYLKYKINGENGFKRWYENNKYLFTSNGGLGLKKRIILCRHIYRIINREKNKMSTKEIYEKLKNIIDNEDLNGQINDKDKNKVLRLERLSYLLNHDDSKKIISQLLLKHIEFIQKIIKYQEQNRKYGKTELIKMNPFFNNTTTLVKIIRDLEENFKINFDIFK